MINNKLELAPFYDLLSTAVYPKLKKQFCYKIGSTYDFTLMGKKQFLSLEDDLELKRNSFLEVLQETRDLIVVNQKKVTADIYEEYGQKAIIKKINELIKDRIKSLKLQKALT